MKNDSFNMWNIKFIETRIFPIVAYNTGGDCILSYHVSFHSYGMFALQYIYILLLAFISQRLHEKQMKGKITEMPHKMGKMGNFSVSVYCKLANALNVFSLLVS